MFTEVDNEEELTLRHAEQGSQRLARPFRRCGHKLRHSLELVDVELRATTELIKLNGWSHALTKRTLRPMLTTRR